MIYAILGTSGSGKSTIAREVMKRYARHEPYITVGRHQPLYTSCMKTDRHNLRVLGHYNTPCGGSDTIHDMDTIFQLCRDLGGEGGTDVLLEGVLLYSVPQRFIELKQQGYPVTVIALTKVPLEECARGVEARRAAKAAEAGTEPKANGPNFEKNLAAKHRGTVSAAWKLRDSKVNVFEADRESALTFLLDALGLPK